MRSCNCKVLSKGSEIDDTRITYTAIAADNPRIQHYMKRLRPVRNPRVNPWLRYEKAKQDLAPLIPKLSGAYDAVIGEVVRRLRL